jgi:hypothetical protein
MTTPTYVMSVPWIQDRVRRTKQLHQDIGAIVVWDETRNAMDTFRRMLELIVEAGDEPAIILEDDIILCTNWRERVEAVIAEHPNQICQFFSMESEESARWLGSRECRGSGFIANLCVYLPAGYASQLLAHSYTYVEEHPEHPTANDFVIRDWLQRRKEKYWLEVPNLVQHESDWVSSVNVRRPRGRKSNFWVEDAS